MLPCVVLMNHSAPFLCTTQRRFKTEPYDLYLYHQSETSVAEIAQLPPAVIVLARRYGFPATDGDFIHKFRQLSLLKAVPIILSLIEGMQLPIVETGVTVVISQPDFSDIQDIIDAVHGILHSTASVN